MEPVCGTSLHVGERQYGQRILGRAQTVGTARAAYALLTANPEERHRQRDKRGGDYGHDGVVYGVHDGVVHG